MSLMNKTKTEFDGVNGGNIASPSDSPHSSLENLSGPTLVALYIFGLAAMVVSLYLTLTYAFNYATFDFSSSEKIGYVPAQSDLTSEWWVLLIIATIVVAFALIMVKPKLFLIVVAIWAGTMWASGGAPHLESVGATPDGTRESIVKWIADNENLTFADQAANPVTAITGPRTYEYVEEDGNIIEGRFVHNRVDDTYTFERVPETFPNPFATTPAE